MKSIRFRLLLGPLLLCCASLHAQDMIRVDGGSFVMGNTAYSRENPIRTVRISTFYLSATTITNTLYAQFLNAYGSDTVKEGEHIGRGLLRSDAWGLVRVDGSWQPSPGFEAYPAVNVSWYGAQAYCRAAGGRLPTEAEWEYAAKGGPSQQTFLYSGGNTAANVAWFSDNAGQLNHPIALKSANTLGLFDMSGNVCQWCSDWFGRYGDFGVTGESNPQGPSTGASKAVRGGYRSTGATDLHLTARESLPPDACLNFVGFRLVLDQLPVSVSPPSTDVVSVYPNPASGPVQVTAPPGSVLSLTDLGGRMHRQLRLDRPTVSLDGLPEGVYLLRVDGPSPKSLKLLIKP